MKPLKDRVVAVVEKPLEKTKSGILLGEAKEKPAYAVVVKLARSRSFFEGTNGGSFSRSRSLRSCGAMRFPQ